MSSTPLPAEDYPTLSILPEDYEIGDAIGFGSSAIVYIATFKPLQKVVSIKMIDLDRFERNQIDELRKEIQVMSLCRHPNLLPVLTTFVHKTKLWIVTPFLSGGSCLDIMKGYFPSGFEEYAIATILKQALQGLAYLHKSGHIHRDVKAGNLLIDKHDGTVRLADFGVSSSFLEDGVRNGIRKTFVGTPCWMAPETEGYDSKADIWSFGITAMELALGSAPFSKYPPMKVIYMTLTNQPPSLDRSKTKYKYSKSFKDMISSCLIKDPTKRPTAEALLKHSFFKLAKKKVYLSSETLSLVPSVNERNVIHQKKSAENDISTISDPIDGLDSDDQGRIFLGTNGREVITGQSWDFRSEVEDFVDDENDNPGLSFSDSESIPGGGRGGTAPIPISYHSTQLSLPIPLAPPNSLSLKEYVLPDHVDLSSFEDASAFPSARNSEIKKGRFSILETAASSSSSLSPSSSANINSAIKSAQTDLDSFAKEELITHLSDSNISSNNSDISGHMTSATSSSTESTLFSRDDDRKLRQEGMLIDAASKSRFTKVKEGNGDCSNGGGEFAHVTITSVEELINLIKATLNMSSDVDLQNLRSIISRRNISILMKDSERGENSDQHDDPKIGSAINTSLFTKLKNVHDQLSLFMKEMDGQQQQQQ